MEYKDVMTKPLLSIFAIGVSVTFSIPLIAQPATVTCSSKEGERQDCPADTSAGIALQRSLGPGECLLGKTWGYDDKSVWVSDGCSGEFVLGQTAPALTTAAATPSKDNSQQAPRVQTWGAIESGKGFLVGRTDIGELSISAYALTRYIDQLPAHQTFTDHLGRVHNVDTRDDIYSHRIMVFFKGWIGLPKLVYTIILWTVNTTDQKAIFAVTGYQFSKKFSLYGGLNGLPGTRSLLGSHPYWLANDRVMADEFFRPFFTNGIWASGEALPGLWYLGMIGNNLSALGVTAVQLTRAFAAGGSVWWMPTTKEFGPQGGYGDWEYHEKLATRFGFSSVRSREDRFGDAASGFPDNTAIRLADSLNVFDPGALAPGVDVNEVAYKVLSIDAGMKYHGIFLQTEVYNRWLNHFSADGPLPVNSIHDKGFYVQGSFYPVKKKIELYAATSQIFGDKSAGFKNSNEYLGGMNYYLAHSRNYRINAQVIRVNRSPVSSSFGYYVGGQKGVTLTTALSIFF
jgi:DUF3011 family protein